MSEILSLKPAAVWKNFHALTQVPRPSGHMEKVTEFLVNFGKSLNLETVVDSVGNVIIRKPAKPEMENRKGLILQAHMDMVPQKNNDTVHDFVNDPIQTYVDGEWVRAKGTTLGADNGMGVAAIMAVLEDDSLQHGYLEALITVDEETGMYGAFGLKAEDIKGEVLLNLDSEDEGELYIGCAGGIDINVTFQYKEVAPVEGSAAVKVVLKGLRGGHSGLEIDKGRANANKLMVRFLREAVAHHGARLASMHGGNMRNAIPREAEAVITVPASRKEEIFKLAAEFEALFVEEYKTIEDNISFKAEETALPAGEMPEEMQDDVINSLYACPNGVFRYIPTIPDTVETSSNLAIVEIGGGKAAIKVLTRSSRESMKDYRNTAIESCFSFFRFNEDVPCQEH